jgi:hypothetical protein
VLSGALALMFFCLSISTYYKWQRRQTSLERRGYRPRQRFQRCEPL